MVNERRREASRLIEEFLTSERMVELMRPDSSEDNAVSEGDYPPGPWSVSGWIVSMEMTSFVGIDDFVVNDCPETWSVAVRGERTTPCQALGLAKRVENGFV